LPHSPTSIYVAARGSWKKENVVVEVMIAMSPREVVGRTMPKVMREVVVMATMRVNEKSVSWVTTVQLVAVDRYEINALNASLFFAGKKRHEPTSARTRSSS
jgi:hypothetical protein